MSRRFFLTIAIGVLLVFFILTLFLPLYTVLAQGLDIQMIVEIFHNRLYLQGLLNAFLISVVTSVLVFMIATPLALLYDRYEYPGKGLCSVLMMAPMILPPFVGVLGFQQILGHYGVLNGMLGRIGFSAVDWLGGEGRFWSICVIEALHLYPILYLNLIGTLANIDPNLPGAARNMGASPWTVFRRVTLPLLRPGILAGGSLVLIWSFTELGTPLMFGFNTVTPVQIFNGITELESSPAVYSLVLITLAVSCLMYGIGRKALGTNPEASISKGSSGSVSESLTGVRKWLPILVFGSFTFVAVTPHLALLLTAFSTDWYRTVLPQSYSLGHFESALSNELVVSSIFNSLKYSSLALVLSLGIGLLIAFLTKRSHLRIGSLFDLLAMLPLMIPGIVLAVGFLGMSIKYSWAQWLFDPIENPLWLIGVAYSIRRIPYVLRSVTAGLEQIPVELEDAARNVGSSGVRAFFWITIPLITANLVVGGLFAFSFSMLEVSDSLILAQKSKFYPVTKAIYELSQYLGAGPYVASAFGVWAMFFLAATLIASGVIIGRKMGSLFRF